MSKETQTKLSCEGFTKQQWHIISALALAIKTQGVKDRVAGQTEDTPMVKCWKLYLQDMMQNKKLGV